MFFLEHAGRSEAEAVGYEQTQHSRGVAFATGISGSDGVIFLIGDRLTNVQMVDLASAADVFLGCTYHQR